MAFRDTNKNNGYHSLYIRSYFDMFRGAAFFSRTLYNNMLLCDKKQFYNSRYRSCFLRAQVLSGVVCCRNKTLSSLIVKTTVVSIWVQLRVMSIESAIYGALPSVFHGFRLSGSSSCPMNYFANVTDGADRQ